MASLLLPLLLSSLPSALAAAFSPAFAIFLACGAASNVSFPNDAPSRTFTPDAPFLSASRATSLANPNANATSPLYAAARASASTFSYRLVHPPATTPLVLRLHFAPFPSRFPELSTARFSVCAAKRYALLSSFSPPRNSPVVVREFFLPADGSGELRIDFAPDASSAAFANAIELFTAPSELLADPTPTPLGAAASNVVLAQQAFDTAYRLNMGGPKVTPTNDTLWRTWLPDDPYLYSAAVAAVNSTTQSIQYVDANNRTRLIAPDFVYKTQRTMNILTASLSNPPLVDFNVTWTFPIEAGATYLVRLHFCDYDVVSSVTGVGLVFNVYVMESLATPGGLELKSYVTAPSQAFYTDYIATAPSAGNVTVSIGRSPKSSVTNAILNGLEMMKFVNATNSMPPVSAGKSMKHVMIIVLPAVLGAAVLACLVLCVLVTLRRCKRAPRPVPDEKESMRLPWSPYAPDDAGSVNLSSKGTTSTPQRVNLELHISFAEIKGATDNFHGGNLIGVGGFGNVYKGILNDGTPVAVKRGAGTSKQGFPEFQAEIVVLSRIRHRHLVSLIGYCAEGSEMILVYEYMEKGPLRGHLYNSDEAPLSWKQRLEICIGAARGLHYLHHGYSDNIIHRDVKSTNILLGAEFEAKVADFGLSRIGPSLGHTHVSTAVKGSFGYLDPEYFRTQRLTDKSDVYSFGVVLLEVLCARPVIDQSLPREETNLAEWALSCQKNGQLDKIVDPRLVGHVNENSLRKFAETAERCLADYGVDRPTMGDVLWNLEYCRLLQETRANREAFEDSGPTDMQFPVEVAPRRMPSSSSFSIGGSDDVSMTGTDVKPGKVFSQLMTSEGR